MVKVPSPTLEILEKTSQSLGISLDDMMLAETFLVEPMAVKTDPERFALARRLNRNGSNSKWRGFTDGREIIRENRRTDRLGCDGAGV